MRFAFVVGLALVVVAAAASAALALNAEAVVDAGDSVYGSIETAGEVDRISLDLPRDATFAVTVKARDAGLALSIALFPPDAPSTEEPLGDHLSGTTAKVKLGGFPVRVTGTWVLEVRAAPGTLGHYKLKTKAAYRTTWTVQETIAGGGQATVPFAAVWGSKLKIKVKPKAGAPELAVLYLDGPGGRTTLPPDLKQSGIPLSQTAEYSVILESLSSGQGEHKTTLKVSTASPAGRKLYLSPRGFGPAPRVARIDPDRALQGAKVPGVQIEGSGIDEGATVILRRSGKPDVPATDVVRVSDGRITCTFDLAALKTGVWEAVVENPSGGQGKTTFNVKDPGSITLPSGIREQTEVWYLEFADSFVSDLALFGLSGTSSPTNQIAAETVEAYVLYYLRQIFGLRGSDGKVQIGAVALSFVVEKPTTLVGSPGTTYNRLRIGGEIQPGEPASDNPSIAWGSTPIDSGNAGFDDLSRDAAPGRGLFLRALRPTVSGSTPAWLTIFTPLLSAPLGANDHGFFSPSFDPANDNEAQRFRQIDAAIRALGREMAAVAAHHIGRAMGLPNGLTGVSSTPSLVGSFADLVTPTYTESETSTLRDAVRPSTLPGSSKTLVATYLRLRCLAPYLLPEVTTMITSSLALPTAGGRPDLQPGDLLYSGVSGFIPLGFVIKQGKIEGTSPYIIDAGTWYYGVFKFRLRIRDSATGDEDLPDHRINVVINLSLVPTTQQTQAQGINTQVRNAP